MKKIILSIMLIVIASAFSNVFAQRETPAGAGDKNLGSDDVKMRSIEIDRIKQEAAKTDAAKFAPINKEIKTNFPQIKEDFESIQISEAAIIKAYTSSKIIDYRLIETSALSINKNAKRLDENLFASKLEVKEEDKPKEKEEKAKSVRDLIVDLDNAIGSFVSSKIFGNIKVIEPEVALKTRTDLDNIRLLSDKLSIEAKKMK